MAGSNTFFDNRLWESQTFTSSGTFNVPSGVNMVFVDIWGGGGAGGRNNGTSTSTIVYGGEAGHNYVGPTFVTPGGSVAVTIGAGGVPPGVAGPGGNGGTSIFSSIICQGGRGGKPFVALSDLASTGNIYDTTTGGGTGKNSYRALGGVNNDAGQCFGGDAGFGNGGIGGVGTNTAGSGGIAAGGGGSIAGASGAGGAGLCIVYWKKA